jgi:hypothetical protein
MAEALLINRNDLVKFTSLNGNADTDKFVQYIKIAQDIHLQNILGTRLLNRIKSDIEDGTLSGNYLTLVTEYIKPVLIHWAMVEYLPWAAYTVANKGVFKHGAENSESVDKNEVDFLVEKERQTAQNYTERLNDYICYNQNLFPEYNENSNADVSPDSDNYFIGWVL